MDIFKIFIYNFVPLQGFMRYTASLFDCCSRQRPEVIMYFTDFTIALKQNKYSDLNERPEIAKHLIRILCGGCVI